nr:basic proline-rich protein-like [Gorilla gorilla gorilla]
MGLCSVHAHPQRPHGHALQAHARGGGPAMAPRCLAFALLPAPPGPGLVAGPAARPPVARWRHSRPRAEPRGTVKPDSLRTDGGLDGHYSAAARRHGTPPPGRWEGRAGPPGRRAAPRRPLEAGGRSHSPSRSRRAIALPAGKTRCWPCSNPRPPPSSPWARTARQPRPAAPPGPADRAPHPRRRSAWVGAATNGRQLHRAHSPGLASTPEALSRQEGRVGARGIQHRAWHRINALGRLTLITLPLPS